jgi:thiol-disulfide isomerase/thioredoxin
MRRLISLFVVIPLLILSSCTKKEEQNKTENNIKSETNSNLIAGNTSKILSVKGTLTESEIPVFSWMNERNQEISINKYKGKVIILNFWATWCGPCIQEIPGFIKVYNEYKSQGVEFIGISLDSELDINDIAKFVGDNDINYQIVLDNGDLQNAYGGIKAIPTTYIIGKDFKVKNHFAGELTEEQIEKLVKMELHGQ